MVPVTLSNLDSFIDHYAKVRDGELNENTTSEAMFVFVSQFGGVYILSTGMNIVWIGIQNAGARWTKHGKSFLSIREAISVVLNSHTPMQSICSGVFYSEDSVERYQWIANQLEIFKSSNAVLLSVKL